MITAQQITFIHLEVVSYVIHYLQIAYNALNHLLHAQIAQVPITLQLMVLANHVEEIVVTAQMI